VQAALKYLAGEPDAVSHTTPLQDFTPLLSFADRAQTWSVLVIIHTLTHLLTHNLSCSLAALTGAGLAICRNPRPTCASSAAISSTPGPYCTPCLPCFLSCRPSITYRLYDHHHHRSPLISFGSHGSRDQLAETERTPTPPPLFRTGYVVAPSSDDDKVEFRQQERIRFANPHLPFTYRLHNYNSIVPPVKGVYTMADAPTKVV
jgi:hypothetical protein